MQATEQLVGPISSAFNTILLLYLSGLCSFAQKVNIETIVQSDNRYLYGKLKLSSIDDNSRSDKDLTSRSFDLWRVQSHNFISNKYVVII